MKGALALAAMIALLPAATDKRPAKEILREFYSISTPQHSGGADEASVERFRLIIRNACKRKARLALELYRDHPEHAKVAELMDARWAAMTNALELADEVDVEVSRHLGEETRADLRRAAYQARARARLVSQSFDRATKRAAIDDALRFDPENERGGVSLMDLVSDHPHSVAEMREAVSIVLAQFPRGRWSAPNARSLKRHLDRIGEPISLRGVDVHSGEDFALESLRGKPTLLMIWDGGFEYCMEEVTAVTRFRSENAPRVNAAGCLRMRWKLERPLPEYLVEHGIDWPVVHRPEETPFEGPFRTPRSPFYWLLDAEGRLASVCYRAAHLQAALDRLEG